MWAESSLPSIYPGGFWGISILSSAVPKVRKLVARVTELFGIICFFLLSLKGPENSREQFMSTKYLNPVQSEYGNPGAQEAMDGK